MRITRSLQALVLCSFVGVAFIPTQAQTLTILYSFKGARLDGADPEAPLLLDSAGNLYGATVKGGTRDVGTVYKLDPSGKETVLSTFAWHNNGAYPYGELVQDSTGNLYGTTLDGWDGTVPGTVFRVDPSGNWKVLHTFSDNPDGAYPVAGLLRDPRGNLYGTTTSGGQLGGGTVFRVAPSGKTDVLYSFKGGAGGCPFSTLTRDSIGNFYGITAPCALDYGAVFKLNKSGESTLYTFSGGADGAYPQGGVILDDVGNLYGVTEKGGAHNKGTLFKIDSSGTYSVLYSFTGGQDGGHPHGRLARDVAGNLYGTTAAFPDVNSAGTVFKLDSNGNFSVLYVFTGNPDGGDPEAGVVLDAAGNLYGTTAGGGTNGAGTIFKISF